MSSDCVLRFRSYFREVVLQCVCLQCHRRPANYEGSPTVERRHVPCDDPSSRSRSGKWRHTKEKINQHFHSYPFIGKRWNSVPYFASALFPERNIMKFEKLKLLTFIFFLISILSSFKLHTTGIISYLLCSAWFVSFCARNTHCFFCLLFTS